MYIEINHSQPSGILCCFMYSMRNLTQYNPYYTVFNLSYFVVHFIFIYAINPQKFATVLL